MAANGGAKTEYFHPAVQPNAAENATVATEDAIHASSAVILTMIYPLSSLSLVNPRRVVKSKPVQQCTWAIHGGRKDPLPFERNAIHAYHPHCTTGEKAIFPHAQHRSGRTPAQPSHADANNSNREVQGCVLSITRNQVEKRGIYRK